MKFYLELQTEDEKITTAEQKEIERRKLQDAQLNSMTSGSFQEPDICLCCDYPQCEQDSQKSF